MRFRRRKPAVATPMYDYYLSFYLATVKYQNLQRHIRLREDAARNEQIATPR